MTNFTSRRSFLRRTGPVASAGLLAASAAAQPTLPNETLKTIMGLRTIHGDFSDKQVPEKDLRVILNATVRAANASALQTYSIIVSRDRAKIQKLTGYQCGCMLLYTVDYNRVIDTAKHVGHEYAPDNIMDFITGSTNTILAAQTAVIAARSLGIDSLLTNGIHRGDMERVWTILDLPQTSCFPLIALLLGYPKTEPDHLKGRLAGPGVIHNEKYHRLTEAELTEIVRQYDDKSLRLGLRDDWDKQGHKHYLDWLHKDWMRARAKPTAAETQALKRFRRSKFVDLQS